MIIYMGLVIGVVTVLTKGSPFSRKGIEVGQVRKDRVDRLHPRRKKISLLGSCV